MRAVPSARPRGAGPCSASRTMLPVMKAMFAGRSASRRMRYGYHCVPNGMYTRTRQPSATSASCRSRRTP